MFGKKACLGAATIIISIAAVLSTKGKERFNNANNIYCTDGSGMASCTLIFTAVKPGVFTTGGIGAQTSMLNANGFIRTLWATSSCCIKAVHFKR